MHYGNIEVQHYHYFSMKQISLLFITLFALIARLNAQTLVGDWDVEALSLRGWVGGLAGILEDEEFESGVHFSSDGKFYCQKIEKGSYRQIGDTLILTRIQNDIRKQEESIRQREEDMKQAIDNYDINYNYINETLRIYTTDTLLLEKNKSGNTLLLLRISSKFEAKPPHELAFYLHKKGTNESINNDNSIIGEWFCQGERNPFTLIFKENGQLLATDSDGNPLFQNGTYTLDGEYLTSSMDNSRSRFLFGNNFAVWQMEPNMQAVIKLLRQTKK